MKILLDPALIWFDNAEDECINFQYLIDVTEFIKRYLNINYFMTQEFVELLIKLIDDTFSQYRESKQIKNQIIDNIWKKLDMSDIVTVEDYAEKVKFMDEFEVSSSQKANINYHKSLNYLLEIGDVCLVFLGIKNHHYDKKSYKNLLFVNHIYSECDSNIAQVISDGVYINAEQIVEPRKNNPLPNSNLCQEYIRIKETFINAGQSDIPVFLKLGQEVALRNRYVKDEYLTRINDAAIREIFKSPSKRPWYLSTDIQHGAIEVCDENGHHVDEYTYDGMPQNKQDKSGKHDIKLER